MGHYKSNVRDLEFNLFETLGLEQVLADEAFGDLDGESVPRPPGWLRGRWPSRSPTATATRRRSTPTPMS
jgi:hypothetical protein